MIRHSGAPPTVTANEAASIDVFWNGSGEIRDHNGREYALIVQKWPNSTAC
jgi:hypothetical protein